jgi:hypothetical protein
LHGLDIYNVYLIDKISGTTTNLTTNPSIYFSATVGMVTDRFVIKVTKNTAVHETIFNIYYSHNMINIQTLSEDWDGKSGSVDLIDMTGKTIRKIGNTEFWKNSLIRIPATGYKGLFFVKIQSGLMRHAGKVMVK